MNKFLPVLLIAASGSLCAQSADVWVSVGASLLSNRDLGSPLPAGPSNDVQLDNGFGFGFRFGLNTQGHIGHELQYTYSRSDFIDNTGQILGSVGKVGGDSSTMGYNFLYYFKKEDSKYRPFATGGVQLDNFSQQAPLGSLYKAGFNYGVGLKMKLTSIFALRFDAREYETGKPDFHGLLFNQSGLLHQTELSAGLGIYF